MSPSILAVIVVIVLICIFLLTVRPKRGRRGRAGAGGAKGADGANGSSGAGIMGFGDINVGDNFLTADQSGTIFRLDLPPFTKINVPAVTGNAKVYYDFVKIDMGTSNVQIISAGGNVIGLGIASPQVLNTSVDQGASWRLVCDGTQWLILFNNVTFANF